MYRGHNETFFSFEYIIEEELAEIRVGIIEKKKDYFNNYNSRVHNITLVINLKYLQKNLYKPF